MQLGCTTNIIMEQVSKYLNEGFFIKWVGYHSEQHVWVHLARKEEILKLVVYLEEDYSKSDFRDVIALGADSPGSHMGTIWRSDTRLELLRLASILGLNVNGTGKAGIGQEPIGETGCVMAYDIESDRSRLLRSSFGTLSESILSIATYCSCGEYKLFSFIPGVDFEYVLCKDSKDTVTKVIEYATEHSPQWFLGYNNFAYDNTRKAYHADDKHDNILIPMRVGQGSSLSYAFYIDIPGAYNIDLLTYLDKTRRSKYENMRLATIAEYHGVEKKMEFDTADMSDLKKFFEYNIHDSKITMELAFKSNVINEICSLSIAMCSPVIDCTRFVSGTLAASSIASYALNNSIRMDWSTCTNVREYRGAEVLRPMLGFHEDVISCDFSSMYPSVLMGACISIDNCLTIPSDQPDGRIWKDDIGTHFIIDNNEVIFEHSKNAIIPSVMEFFVGTRRKVRKTKPDYANCLKVGANSIYGTLGDRYSRIYNPFCSAAVTSGGRWCLSLAETILRMMGYTVIYGDTDSCLVKKRSPKTDIHTAVDVLSIIFSYTPFPGMSMEVERTYSAFALLGKKTYFGKEEGGSFISKGMSQSRKDRLGICRLLSSFVIPSIMHKEKIQYKRQKIADMITTVLNESIWNNLRLEDVSKIKKKGGTNSFEYRNKFNKFEDVDCETAIGNEMVEYSSAYVCKSIVREMNTILRVTGIGTVDSILRYSMVI